MDVASFLIKTSYALRGTDDLAPTFGDEEAVQWLSVLNSKKDELYRDTRTKWQESFSATSPNEPGTVATAGTTTLTGTSTYFSDYRVGDTIVVSGETVRTIATIPSNTSLTVTVAFSTTASALTFTRATIIATGVQSYNLHRSFLAPSDQAIITTTSDIHYQNFLKPQERNDFNGAVYITGLDPKVITFIDTIAATSDLVGGTLSVPGYYLPSDLTAATDLLPFPDPNWGVMSVASEIAFNDLVYEDKSSGLNEKANALYRAMVAQNRAGTFSNPRRIPYTGYRIKSPTRR